MKMQHPFLVSLVSLVSMAIGAAPSQAVPFEIAKLYIEYNQTADDLGFHVSLDGEDWKKLDITSPAGHKIFKVSGKAGYAQLGMTELFFEGAEPTLSEFPLDELLALFPEGIYEFEGRTVDNVTIDGAATLSHAVPNGPANAVATFTAPSSLVVSWDPVTTHPAGFPDLPISIVSYQVLVDPFEVVVPAGVTSLTVSPEFAASLGSGPHPFEVLAIDVSGNQSITEGTFTVP